MYFSITTVTRECLFLAMIKEREAASTGLLCIAAVACYLLIPFLDALSPEVVGPTHVRVVCTPPSRRVADMHLQCFCSSRSSVP